MYLCMYVHIWRWVGYFYPQAGIVAPSPNPWPPLWLPCSGRKTCCRQRWPWPKPCTSALIDWFHGIFRRFSGDLCVWFSGDVQVIFVWSSMIFMSFSGDLHGIFMWFLCDFHIVFRWFSVDLRGIRDFQVISGKRYRYGKAMGKPLQNRIRCWFSTC